MARALSRLDRAGELDRTAEKQQLLGQRRLAGVGVGDDGEGAPAGDLATHVGGSVHREARSVAADRPVPSRPTDIIA